MPRPRNLPSWALAAALATLGAGCLLDSGPFSVVAVETTTSGAGGSGGAGGAAGSETTTSGPKCGDSVKDSGEQCDDGNTIEGDGCFECKIDCGCPGCEAGTPCAECGPFDDAVTLKDPVSKHCYVYIPLERPQDLAREMCANWGGDLAAPSTQAEMEWILASDVVRIFDLSANGRCWTGGLHQGTWDWLNGETWLLPPEGPEWEPGNPNGGEGTNCVVIGPNGTIRDRECGEPFPFLCERAPK